MLAATGIEIAAIVVLVVVAVALVVLVAGLIAMIGDELRRRRRTRPGFTITDVHLTATRPKVLPNQATDLRFQFTVRNPRGLRLTYDGTLAVEDHADVNQQNTFMQNSLTTVVQRLGAKWGSVGTKKVSADVTVPGAGYYVSARAEGSVEVVAELEED